MCPRAANSAAMAPLLGEQLANLFAAAMVFWPAPASAPHSGLAAGFALRAWRSLATRAAFSNCAMAAENLPKCSCQLSPHGRLRDPTRSAGFAPAGARADPKIPWASGWRRALPESEVAASSTLEATMPEDAPRLTRAAIRTDLGAIFVSLELSRRAWLITSL